MEELHEGWNSAFGPSPHFLSKTRHAFCTTAAPRHVLPPPLEVVPYKQRIADVEKGANKPEALEVGPKTKVTSSIR